MMDELTFKLEIYEGPLDLMLSLIKKHKLDITDIEISVLLEQFLLYLDRMNEADIEVTSDFLEMAARLIYIKSAALLPKHEKEELKRELEGTLIEYAQAKIAANNLRNIFLGNDVFVRTPMPYLPEKEYKNQHLVSELVQAYIELAEKGKKIKKETPTSVKPAVPKPTVSVFTQVVYVLKRLKSGGNILTNHLYNGLSRSEAVATFLALLELVKAGRIAFSDDNSVLYFNAKISQ